MSRFRNLVEEQVRLYQEEKLEEKRWKDIAAAAALAGAGAATMTNAPERMAKWLIPDDEITQEEPEFLRPNRPTIDWSHLDEPRPQTPDIPAQSTRPSPPPQQVSIQEPRTSGKTWQHFDLEQTMDFLSGLEGFSTTAYPDGCMLSTKQLRQRGLQRCPDSEKRFSIGYGTLAPGNNPNATITRPEARQAKINYIKRNILPRLRGIEFESQQAFDSTVSFVYNTGRRPPTKPNGELDFGAMSQITGFMGREHPGLVRRRNTEFINMVAGRYGDEEI